MCTESAVFGTFLTQGSAMFHRFCDYLKLRNPILFILNPLEVGLEIYVMHALLVLHPLSAGFHMCMAKAEKCLALQMAVNIYLGAGPSGKVDKTKRKESCNVEQNGGCRVRNNKITNKITHFNYLVLSTQKSLKDKKDRVNVSVTRPSSTPICEWQASKSFEDIMIMLHNLVNCTCV